MAVGGRGIKKSALADGFVGGFTDRFAGRFAGRLERDIVRGVGVGQAGSTIALVVSCSTSIWTDNCTGTRA
jgi:hypothetical protein